MIKSKLVKTRCRNVFENVYLIWLQNIYIYIYIYIVLVLDKVLRRSFKTAKAKVTSLFIELTVFCQALRKCRFKLYFFMAVHKRVESSAKFINCCKVFFDNLKRIEN